MNQKCYSYSISGAVITLTGVNRPQEALLSITDLSATPPALVWQPQGGIGTIASYTQAANSVITLGSAISSNSAKLLIIYDDGVASSNAPAAITNYALESGGVLATISTAIANIYTKIQGSIAVTGTFWQATQPVSLASVPTHGITSSDLGTASDTTASSDSGTFSLIALFKRGLAYLAHLTDGTQTTSVIIPSSFKTGQAKIAVTGTAVQLGSNTLTQGVLISAKASNAADITIGTSSGLTNTTDGTGNGLIVPAGSTKSVAATNTNLIYINGTAGDIVSFIGS